MSSPVASGVHLPLLPTEVRLMILRYVLMHWSRYGRKNSFITLPPSDAETPSVVALWKVDHYPYYRSILLTCKKLYEETMSKWLGGTSAMESRTLVMLLHKAPTPREVTQEFDRAFFSVGDEHHAPSLEETSSMERFSRSPRVSYLSP